jgi:stage V sporulation protein SpoVS
MMASSGWQPHSVRGAIAGSLKKRGLVITSAKDDGERRYRCKPSRSVDARG